jgi:hypothetical protein
VQLSFIFLFISPPTEMSFFSKLFSGEPAPDQKTVLRQWTRELNKKIRYIERDIESTSLFRSEMKE